MFGHLLETLGQFGKWNYLVLAALVIVEGPVATLIGAGLAAVGILKPLAVFIVASISNMLSDFLWYYLGRLGGQKRLKYILRKVGAQEEMVNVFMAKMHQHVWKVLFTAKITLSFSIPALVSAGIMGISWRKVLMALLPAEILWTGSLVVAGYYFGQFIQRFEQGVRVIGIVGGVAFAILMVHYVRRHLGNPEEGF